MLSGYPYHQFLPLLCRPAVRPAGQRWWYRSFGEEQNPSRRRRGGSCSSSNTLYHHLWLAGRAAGQHFREKKVVVWASHYKPKDTFAKIQKFHNMGWLRMVKLSKGESKTAKNNFEQEGAQYLYFYSKKQHEKSEGRACNINTDTTREGADETGRRGRGLLDRSVPSQLRVRSGPYLSDLHSGTPEPLCLVLLRICTGPATVPIMELFQALCINVTNRFLQAQV